jgi:hypothetical protein
MNLSGRFQEAWAVYYITQNECAGISVSLKDLTPTGGTTYGDYIADGTPHINDLEDGAYVATLAMDGLTYSTSKRLFRLRVKKGLCDGDLSGTTFLIKEDLNPTTREVIACRHLGF